MKDFLKFAFRVLLAVWLINLVIGLASRFTGGSSNGGTVYNAFWYPDTIILPASKTGSG